MSGMPKHKSVRKLSRQYASILHGYLVQQQETTLQHAYELGREEIARGMGVLDMARIHQQGLASCLSRPPSPEEITRTLRAAETFLMESLSPFEAARRGFDDANLRLRQLYHELELRN